LSAPGMEDCLRFWKHLEGSVGFMDRTRRTTRVLVLRPNVGCA
jgi:hypothetical protein